MKSWPSAAHSSTNASAAVLAAALAFAAVACSSDSVAPSSSVVERRISPTDVNHEIVRWTDDHFVWVVPHTQSPKLAVLLSGTSGAPSSFKLIGKIAAEQGYHVIGLMYPDDRAVVVECADDPAPDCMESMRREIVEGTDVSPHVDVDEPNSIDGRLAGLLVHLAQAYPDEGWSQFVAGGRLEWNAIVIAGHSQGGGHAAFIAREHTVARVVMFGAPADGYNDQPAPWMQLGATPSDRYFGFKHERDPFTSIVPNWMALGLGDFGPVQDVVASTMSLGDSHMLVTDLLPASGSYLDGHASVFADQATPKRTDGSPVFDVAWRYLMGRP